MTLRTAPKHVRPGWLAGLERTRLRMLQLTLVLVAVAMLQPPQPIRFLVVAAVLAAPGVALAWLLSPPDPVLFTLVTVSAALAIAVVVSTGLLYVGVSSWQVSLLVVGLLAAGVFLLDARTGSA